MGCICAKPSPNGSPLPPVRLAPSPVCPSPTPSYKASKIVSDHPLPVEHLAYIPGPGTQHDGSAQCSSYDPSAYSLPISPQYSAEATQTSGGASSGYHSFGYPHRMSSSNSNEFIASPPELQYRYPVSRGRVADRDTSSGLDYHGYDSKRVPCEWPGCNATFSRKADVNRHMTCTHQRIEYIDCPIKNCARKGENGFTRKDHLLEHKRGYHCMDLSKRHGRQDRKRGEL